MKRTYVSGNKFLLWIGLILHLVYYALTVTALLTYGDHSDYGLGTSGGLWIYAIIVAVPVILNYLTEGVLAVIRRRSAFNVIKLILVAALVPLFIFCGMASGVVRFVIWNVVFLAAFVVEIISLFKDNFKKPHDEALRSISQNDLLDLRLVFLNMRAEPSFAGNKAILQTILNELKQPIIGENKFRAALSELDIPQSEKWQFIGQSNVNPYTVIIKDSSIYDTLERAIMYLMKYLDDEGTDMFAAAADALHNLPVMICENNYTIPKKFFRNEVREFRKSWDKNFLKYQLVV